MDLHRCSGQHSHTNARGDDYSMCAECGGGGIGSSRLSQPFGSLRGGAVSRGKPGTYPERGRRVSAEKHHKHKDRCRLPAQRVVPDPTAGRPFAEVCEEVERFGTPKSL